jgi:hypothetical protein
MRWARASTPLFICGYIFSIDVQGESMITTHGSQACEERDNNEAPEERRGYTRTSSVVETDFAEIGDGTLVEMIEDPEDTARTLLAVYKGGEVHYTSRFQSGDRVLIPIPRNDRIIKHMRLPRGVRACESERSLLIAICALLSQCLDLDVGQPDLLAFFVLSTWFIEQLPVAPYVALVGLSQSGKTMALYILSLLCRHALFTADITSTAFYRIYDRLTPTVLIDETGTAGEKRGLLQTTLGKMRLPNEPNYLPK